MKILLIMLVVVVGMKVFANDNEKMLKTWVTNTDPIMTDLKIDKNKGIMMKEYLILSLN